MSLSTRHDVPTASISSSRVVSGHDGATSTLRMRYTDVPHTLDVMAALARRDRSADSVREAANTATLGSNIQDPHEVARAIHRYIRNRVRWIPDAHNVELVQAPRVTLKSMYGDCDDQSALAAAMLAAVGVGAGFEAIQYKEPGVWDHVYALYFADDEWHMLDPTSRVVPGANSLRPMAYERYRLYLHEQDNRAPEPDTDMRALATNYQAGSGMAVRAGYDANTGYSTKKYASNTPPGSGYDLMGLSSRGLAQTNVQTTGSETEEIPEWQKFILSLATLGPDYIEALQSGGTIESDGSITFPEGGTFARQQEAGFFSSTTGQIIIGGAFLGLAGTVIYLLMD